MNTLRTASPKGIGLQAITLIISQILPDYLTFNKLATNSLPNFYRR